jgi:hypothetical protein
MHGDQCWRQCPACFKFKCIVSRCELLPRRRSSWLLYLRHAVFGLQTHIALACCYLRLHQSRLLPSHELAMHCRPSMAFLDASPLPTHPSFTTSLRNTPQIAEHILSYAPFASLIAAGAARLLWLAHLPAHRQGGLVPHRVGRELWQRRQHHHQRIQPLSRPAAFEACRVCGVACGCAVVLS